jgi:hypothetical protein
MTYNNKNTFIVFAFAALMMAMPFATGNAFAEEMDASLNSSCGFTTTSAESINFGAFSATDNASTVGEEDAVFPAVVGATTSARVQVTFADWFGTGTRAAGSLTLVNVADAETVDIGTQTYTATTSASSGTSFNINGNDAADALELANQVRITDSANIRVSTTGSNTLTLQAENRGTAGNSLTLTESVGDAGTVLTGFSGAVDTPQLVMDGETTRFTWSSSSAQTTAYAAKDTITTLGTSQEVLGGTDPAGSVHLALMVDPATAVFGASYDGPITQTITITVESACDGT